MAKIASGMTSAAFVALCLLHSVLAFASSKQIALTFDDAPRYGTSYFSGRERAKRFLAGIRSAGISQVAFFCNTERFDGEGLKRVKSYAKAGHLIANHSHSHKDLHLIGARKFIEDVQQAHAILQGFPNFKNWFRFPFLHEGQTVDERDEVRVAIANLGYSQGYVTIDNYDWYMDRLFQEAVRAKKRVNFDRLRRAYLEILTAGIEFYDSIAVKTLARSPKHVMLLHENDLAALYAGDLAQHLRAKGWEIISVEDAYRDPIANIEPATLMLGQGRVAAIAVDRGYQGSIVSDWDSESGIEAEFERRRVWETGP